MGGSVEKEVEKPWACIFTLPPCPNRCRFSEGNFSTGAPTIEIKIEQRVQNTKVASAKVAFDTVREKARIRAGKKARTSMTPGVKLRS